MDEREKRRAGEREESKEKRGATVEGEMDITYECVMDEDAGHLGGGGEESDCDVHISRHDDRDRILKETK